MQHYQNNYKNKYHKNIVINSHRHKNTRFKKKKVHNNNRLYISLILLLIISFLWAYFLFASKFFKITEWEIKNFDNKEKKILIENIIKDFFQKRNLLFFKNSNIFLFDNDEFKKQLEESEIIIENIVTEKLYPQKINLNIEDKKEKIIIYGKNNLLSISEDGIVLKISSPIGDAWRALEITGDATSTDSITHADIDNFLNLTGLVPISKYPIFYNAYYDNVVRVGDSYKGKETISNLKIFLDNLYARTEIKVKLITIYKNNNNEKIILFTNNGWKIYINSEEDGEKQFYKLFLVFNNQIKDINKPLEYIDLRFGDRVYTK